MKPSLITILLNKTSAINSPEDFTRVVDVSANAVRKILLGDRPESANVVKNLMKTHMQVWHQVDSATALEIIPTVANVAGGTLVGTANGAPYVKTQEVTVWPADLEITVTFAGTNYVKVENSGKIYHLECTISNGTHLSVTWPPELGISGDIELDAPYSPATSVKIPQNFHYPLDLVKTELEKSNHLLELLIATDLAENYYIEVTTKAKLAIVGLALYKFYNL